MEWGIARVVEIERQDGPLMLEQPLSQGQLTTTQAAAGHEGWSDIFRRQPEAWTGAV